MRGEKIPGTLSSMPRVVAIINVRMGSERLPGKTMRMVEGKPLLGHLLWRVRQARAVDDIVVATPDSAQNDVIEEYCHSVGAACFRGAENDLITRTLGALDWMKADIGVEIYGDGPLIDPAMIEECLGVFMDEGPYDLVGNDMKGTYPSGMYTEAFSVASFRDSDARTNDLAIREHGTFFLRKHPDLYRIRNIEARGNLRRPDIHLDVDTEEDFRVIVAIVKHFVPRQDFTLAEIITFLDANPAIRESNAHVHRRWKQHQSS